MSFIYPRKLKLPNNPSRSFFLWGPRQVGKTSLLRDTYPDTIRIDLLKSDLYSKYLQRPELLREELLAISPLPSFVIIDEIQKLPMLLNEVHWLIEEKKIAFGLCGSSARKLKRGTANLLGGRAVRFELQGLVSAELGEDFNLERILNYGYLPLNYGEVDPLPGIRSYVADYLKEEIAAEGIVRNLPAFSRFLEVAAINDTEIVKYTNIAADCGVSSPTVKEYFQILEDTQLGKFLPAYTKSAKRKIIKSPKFYLFDIGIVNFLSKRGEILLGSPLAGHALENFIHHELYAYSIYNDLFFEMSYWKLAQGTEVDFIINDMEIAIEVKSSKKITNKHLKGLRELKKEYPKVGRRIMVANESIKRITDDGIEIFPVREFLNELWSNNKPLA